VPCVVARQVQYVPLRPPLSPSDTTSYPRLPLQSNPIPNRPPSLPCPVDAPHHAHTVVAISPNNAEVHIYDAVSWTCLHVLKEHDLLVSAVDWSVDNKIVTCSHDRNAFVWTFDAADGVWKPMLVILRVERAAMQVGAFTHFLSFLSLSLCVSPFGHAGGCFVGARFVLCASCHEITLRAHAHTYTHTLLHNLYTTPTITTLTGALVFGWKKVRCGHRGQVGIDVHIR